jgi:SAM-dependent methyltransferase
MTDRAFYEKEFLNGITGSSLSPKDLNRLRFTAELITKEVKSILDIGCCCGQWLNFVTKYRKFEKHLGIDISEARIKECQKLFPDLNVKRCAAEELNIVERFDVVTSLEVLEHILDWKSVFDSLFKHAEKQVIVTVPYREQIQYHICIHCGQRTPSWGHVNSFSEDSFPIKEGWDLHLFKIREKNPTQPIMKRFYRFIKPRYPWIAAIYRKSK